jgi:hypothetical protein
LLPETSQAATEIQSEATISAEPAAVGDDSTAEIAIAEENGTEKTTPAA